MGKFAHDPVRARDLTEQLKDKSRGRRARLAGVAAATSSPRPRRNDTLPRLDLLYVPLEDLRAPPRTVRELDSGHIREVANSIGALGFCAPILIGKDNVILDGVIRIEAARLLGLPRAPCIRAEHLSEAEQRVLRLAVNRLGEKGEWNLNELKIEFEDLVLIDAPIEISGFTTDEIDHIVLDEADAAIEGGPSRRKPAQSRSPAWAMFLRLDPTASSVAARPTLRQSSD